MGAAVAAAVIRKEKELVEHFRQTRAVAPASARSASDLGIHEDFAWSALRRRAVIREAGPGMFYLDEAAWVALARWRRRMALVVAVVILSAAITVLSITMSIRR